MYRMEEHIQRAELCKKEILKYRPFEGEMLDEIQNFYRIATTWASNALEGNTLTIGETKVLLEDGITVGGKPLRDTLEACGHADAYDYMFTLLHHDGITIEDISMLHQLFYQKIDFHNAGQYRKTPVRISGSEVILPPASKVPAEMDKLNRWIRENEHAMHPVAYAAELHRRFVEIHPFKDGNGRTARLMMNVAFIQNGYLPCVISPQLRLEYLQALEEAHDVPGRKGKPEKFISFVAEMETETEKDFIRSMGLEMPDFSQMSAKDDVIHSLDANGELLFGKMEPIPKEERTVEEREYDDMER